MAELNFNAEEYEPMGSFDPLPVGEYVVVIESSEKKPASTGKGEYLQLVYNVIDGEYQGRRLFDRLNIENESEQAQTIARRALSSICRAIGIMNPKTSEELHDKPFVVKVGIRPAKGEYGPSNKITEYKSTDGTLPSVPEKKPEKKPETTTPAASAKKKMPWQKK
jgi:hypothetical protein